MQKGDRDKKWIAGVVLLLGAGLGLRAWGAWCLQYAPNSDYGIVGLMAKHMAEGTDYPVFFYGQAYMGSFEPAVSALLCLLMGVGGFAVCLGSALLSWFLLPILYLWGCDTRDRVAGLASLLFCTLGSFTLFFYSVAPRGGYASALVLGSLTVWLAVRITQQTASGGTPTWWSCLSLGFTAGLAWWSNQLVVPFLGAAAVVMLMGLGGRVFRLAVLGGGGLGFLVGSLPWWVWNAFNQWRTFKFGGTVGGTPFTEGVPIFGRMAIELLEGADKPLAVSVAVGVAYAVLAAGYAMEWRARWREAKASVLPLLAPLLVIVFMMFAFSVSSFARMSVVRYVLPVFPAVAVMVGVGTARLVRRTWLGWIPLVWLIGVQCCFVPGLMRYREECRPTWTTAGKVADFMQRQGIGIVHGSYGVHWMNFASREALCVTGLDSERYAPYAWRVATAGKVAYFSDHLGIEEFIARSGGSASSTSVAGHQLLYEARPPSAGTVPLPAEAVQTVIAGPDRRDLGHRLGDLDLDTGYSVTLLADEKATVDWTLSKGATLCGLRLFSASAEFPARLCIEGRKAGDIAWAELLPSTETTTLFWSGPRIFFQGFGTHIDYRFPPGEYVAIRLHLFPFVSRTLTVSLGEAVWLQPADEPVTEPAGGDDIEALVSWLKAQGIERCYAPRWIAEQVDRRTRGAVETFVPPVLTSRLSQSSPRRDMRAIAVEVRDRKTALVVRRREVDQTRQSLATIGLAVAESVIGDWVLFECSPVPTAKGHVHLPLFWSEMGCFLASRHGTKANADYWYRQAESLGTSPDAADDRVAAWRRALEFYPAYQPALTQLDTMLSQAGRTNEAALYRQEWIRQTQPERPLQVRFLNEVLLLGADYPSTAIRCGQTFPVDYFWQCTTNIRPDRWAVFVHFVRERDPEFQDDHVFLTEVLPEAVERQPFPEVFKESRLVRVPPGTKPGDYRLRLGLYDRVTHDRARPRTELPVESRAVWLPGTLRIIE